MPVPLSQHIDPRPAVLRWLKFTFAKDGEMASKYRALRTLAISANDHIREVEFFASEMRARRFWVDRPFGRGSGRFWLGWLYDAASDFGRSLWRPMVVWTIIQVAAAGVYFSLYASAGPVTKPTRWEAPGCLSGAGSAVSEAMVLSLINSVPQTGISSERAKSAQTCLYGTTVTGTGTTAVGLFSFPTAALITSIAQCAASLTTLFLIGLAIRNYFKIH